MKKYLISGFSSTYGYFGGILSAVIKANSKEEAREKARKKFGDNFGASPAFTGDPRGIKIQRTELDAPQSFKKY